MTRVIDIKPITHLILVICLTILILNSSLVIVSSFALDDDDDVKDAKDDKPKLKKAKKGNDGNSLLEKESYDDDANDDEADETKPKKPKKGSDKSDCEQNPNLPICNLAFDRDALLGPCERDPPAAFCEDVGNQTEPGPDGNITDPGQQYCEQNPNAPICDPESPQPPVPEDPAPPVPEDPASTQNSLSRSELESDVQVGTLTLRKINTDSQDLIEGGIFEISPGPFDSMPFTIVRDNDPQLDRDARDGIVLLNNVSFSSYVINEIDPEDPSLYNSAEISLHVQDPHAKVNFITRNLGEPLVEQIIPNQYIVVFNDQVTTEDFESIANFVESIGIEIMYRYTDAFNGLAIKADNENLLNQIQEDPRLKYIEQDKLGRLASSTEKTQIIPTGINRIDAELTTHIKDQRSEKDNYISKLMDKLEIKINESDRMNNITNEDPIVLLTNKSSDLDVDIAILDTGVSMDHPDLNVYKNVTFVSGTTSGDDDHGHGSHVAGIAAARDNSMGVVGVAPGARIWAIKICDKLGNCPLSTQIEGIEYITEHSDEIDVANISIENPESPTLDAIINKSISSGVLYVVASGNSGGNASSYSPGNNPSVITVSAISDTDGRCGGMGPSTIRGDDDTFGKFSNSGTAVNLAAPGVNILSTYNGTEYAVHSGTSMAAAHVAGAAALLISKNTELPPQEIVNKLEMMGLSASIFCDREGRGYFEGDTHDVREPLVYLGDLTN